LLPSCQGEFHDQLDELVMAWRALPGMAIAVTNEAGWGLVSTYRSGRVFTELLGEVNQEMAAASDEVIMIVSGRPLHVTAHMITTTIMAVNALSIEAPMTSPVIPPSR